MFNFVKGSKYKQNYGFRLLDLAASQVFLIDYGDMKSISIVLDLHQNIATVITSMLPVKEDTSIPMLQRAEQGMPLSSFNASFEHVLIIQLRMLRHSTRRQKN